MNTIEKNKERMKRFEVMINTNDIALAQELVSDEASFYTPASPVPLYGGKGYLSVVDWMRTGFSDVQWKLEEMVVSEDKAAVRWILTGTHDGEFLGIHPTGNKISVCVMNFYYFDENGKIVNDVAAEGMIGILRGIGAVK
ncbi:MAG: ester cyclase [Succiniclasticum sp.]|uniref:ester cyclase n=1 Tax=Succiniclasticum sp. TaxID=2775030 RepID=UPI002A91C4B9|nr:ester cyclase [Succiniclasticum sp.]MDY6290543.1 ester cyclase [Succiniclasticum sp.]